MSNLLLARDDLSPYRTLGQLYLGRDSDPCPEIATGLESLCHTLEDRIRRDGELVPGTTAIPAGLYPWRMTFFNHGGYWCPGIYDVPGRSNILIHIGNYPSNTRGCPLVGFSRGINQVTDSKKAFEYMLTRIGKEGSIRVTNPKDYWKFLRDNP